ncbi:MAG: glutamine-hydrolyzing carbamoyl-phosphate synthase small subunit [Elusimicrobiota bacterium]|jgi:carbamoyl-phosphate synthase small subunit|nr:glutamine-hydrolyzing carbamoyl-phosphate synthase small subunit [Elusimicrobiota bacterium]
MKIQFNKEYQKAVLELSNGVKMQGRLIGANAVSSGEMVFTTAMTAYGEAMADPSYLGQILVFSFSLIGNYGVPPLKKTGGFFLPAGWESDGIKTQGIIAGDTFDECFHYEKGKSIKDWLKEAGVPGIAGIDTRRLVQMIRDAKTPLFGRIVPQDKAAAYDNTKFDFLKNFTKKDFVDPNKYNILPSVSIKKPLKLGAGKTKIAIADFGVNQSVVKALLEGGCAVELLPWDADITAAKADGWLLSNGPGDPQNTGPLINNIKKLLAGGKPVFGLGLGYQIMALAAGAKTKKLKSGHRSFNQPVFEVKTRRAFMSSQNHSFEVDGKTLPRGWETWFKNANDLSIEGLRHKTKPFMGTQFDALGGIDTNWIIQDFIDLVKGTK